MNTFNTLWLGITLEDINLNYTMGDWLMKLNKIFLIAVFLLIVGCSKNKSIPGNHGAASALKNKSFFDEVGQVTPYNVNSKYAEAMNECVYADTEKKYYLV